MAPPRVPPKYQSVAGVGPLEQEITPDDIKNALAAWQQATLDQSTLSDGSLARLALVHNFARGRDLTTSVVKTYFWFLIVEMNMAQKLNKGNEALMAYLKPVHSRQKPGAMWDWDWVAKHLREGFPAALAPSMKSRPAEFFGPLRWWTAIARLHDKAQPTRGDIVKYYDERQHKRDNAERQRQIKEALANVEDDRSGDYIPTPPSRSPPPPKPRKSTCATPRPAPQPAHAPPPLPVASGLQPIGKDADWGCNPCFGFQPLTCPP
ncbi:unnamed protein product [Peniophora sp. CBMAI 1063]|nr:unnamed protein product [Peniophora sp. CBMAI 1063]